MNEEGAPNWLLNLKLLHRLCGAVSFTKKHRFDDPKTVRKCVNRFSIGVLKAPKTTLPGTLKKIRSREIHTKFVHSTQVIQSIIFVATLFVHKRF